MLKLSLTFFIYGLLFGVGPCLASCGPLLVAYFSGSSKNILMSLLEYAYFSLAKILAYLLITLSVFSIGKVAARHIIGEYSVYIFIVGGIFIILVGLSMIVPLGSITFEEGKNKIFDRLTKFIKREVLPKSNKMTIIILGLLIGLLPCLPLLTIASYIGLASSHWTESILYGLAFGLGTSLSPLVMLVFFSGMISRFVRSKNYARVFRIVCGLIIIFLGFKLIGGGF
ncbi:MAG: sulfite exporter TauE/SafE family protein [Candidatus Omnitrophota bacterium]|nr:sulfite exporter TauE/SafE family protein [Candidatus Omnitrophota bacterium]